MLGFIKQELEKAGLTKQAEEAVTESAIDQEILECAHLIQELDDLTLEGTDPMAARRLDIPLMDDDIEVTSLEVDLLDGRITNMPADAAVQTEYTNFSRMKTFDDFYQEAADSLMQMVRETDEAFEKRICAEAAKRQRAYHDYIVQEGLFGHDMININDDGMVYISSPDLEAADKAKTIITGIVSDPEVGTEYDGTVTRLMDFGAFVEFLPGKEGLVHISKMAWNRVEKVEDVLHEGDKVHVKLIEIDSQGRLNLSIRDCLPKPEGYVEEEPRRRENRPNRERRGGFGGRNGGRNEDNGGNEDRKGRRREF